jgi:hypothetical protein
LHPCHIARDDAKSGCVCKQKILYGADGVMVCWGVLGADGELLIGLANGLVFTGHGLTLRFVRR